MKRRIISVILALLVFTSVFAILPPEAFAAASGTGWYRVISSDGLRLRKEPTISSSQVGILQYGYVVNVTEIAGDWGKTTYSGKTGWIHLDYAEKTENPATTGGKVDVYAKLDQMRVKFPHGKYWNWMGKDKKDLDKWTETPCPSTGRRHTDTSHCNGQCDGFARKLGLDIFGYSTYDKTHWETKYDLSDLCVGDLIRYNSKHTIMVVGRKSDDVLVIVDCNYDCRCGIRWDADFSISRLISNVNWVLHAKGNNYLATTDKQKPAISELKATVNSDRTALEISCKVSDNNSVASVSNKVTSPLGKTVTVASTISGGKAVASVPLSTFGDAVGEYTVEVTAQDASNNKATASTKVKVEAPTAFSFTLTPAENTIFIGGTCIITPVTQGTLPSATTKWSSSDSSIATVNSSGIVTGLKAGKVTITADIDGVKATSTVTVMKPLIDSLTAVVSSDSKTINVTCKALKDTKVSAMTFTCTSPSGSKKTVDGIVSDNTSVVSFKLSDFGSEHGKYLVTATAKDNAGNASSETVSVDFKESADVSLSLKADSPTIFIGQTTIIRPSITGNASSSSIGWASSDPFIASVSPNGLVTGINGGTATIYAVIGNVKATCNVTVKSTTVARIGGVDRLDTAELIAESGWGGTNAKNVVIANAHNFVDALAGVPLAKALDAPILLATNKNGQLDQSVWDKLHSLNANNIYLLGGKSVISSNIQTALTAAGYSVTRIDGSDRYETAVKIAQQLEKVTGKKPAEVFFSSSTSYPDALAISSAAAISDSPILYAPASGSVDSKTAAYAKACGAASAVVLGGTKAISDSTYKSIEKLGFASVGRIFGSDRYDTCSKICSAYKHLYTGKGVAFAIGTSFPDALAGGAFAAKKGIPVVLVSGTSVNSQLAAFSKAQAGGYAYIFGGEKAVPDKAIIDYLD